MMAAFEGKKVKGLHKIKIDEKALAARKHAIAHNSVLPDKKRTLAAHAHKVARSRGGAGRGGARWGRVDSG